MKAVVLRGPKTLELMDVPEPKLQREDHVLINVKACGICGSDLRYWAGENPWALHTLGYHVDNPPNIIMGHEYAGTVCAVNSAKHEHLIGRRVGVQSFRVCGECGFCRSGRPNLCKATVHMGHGQGWGQMDFYPGAYAEYCLGWGDLVYPIPDGVSFEEAALGDVFCVAVHAVGRTRIPPGAPVLCIGGGPIGLSIAQVARARGAGQVLIAETSALARQVLSRFDFTIFDPAAGSLRDALSQHLNAPQVAAIYDSVGTAETVTEALPLLEESGTYVNLAVHNTSINLNASLLGSERTLTTSSNALYSDVREAYRLIFARRVNAAALISHSLPLEDYQRAFDLLLSAPKQAYKVVLTPG